MSIEASGDLGFGLNSIRQGGLKLRTATLTDSKNVRGCFYDTEPALCHDSSLPPSREPVDFKRHHYQSSPALTREHFGREIRNFALAAIPAAGQIMRAKKSQKEN